MIHGEIEGRPRETRRRWRAKRGCVLVDLNLASIFVVAVAVLVFIVAGGIYPAQDPRLDVSHSRPCALSWTCATCKATEMGGVLSHTEKGDLAHLADITTPRAGFI